MAQVVILVHEENGWYGASFPDFPGCTAVEADLDTLYAKAAEVLAWHAASMVEDGEALPRVRGLSELRNDPAFQQDAADAALVGFVNIDLPGRTVRVNITMDEGTLALIDKAAAAAGETRSGFLARAARKRAAEERGAPTSMEAKAPVPKPEPA